MSDAARLLKTAFDTHISNKYGAMTPPAPYITPFGVKTLDALLGGGFQSSAPIGISSTPETGKSTISLQFAASFQRAHQNCVAVYINIEEPSSDEGDGTMAGVTVENNTAYQSINDRIQAFGIDPTRFSNKPAELNVKQVFDMIRELITIKRKIQDKTGNEFRILIIWDSIAATPSSKDASAEDPNEIIGFKAREMTFNLSKIKADISMERVSFILIDQVRANMKIESRFQAATNERGVGDFGNYKSATAVSALQHNLRQWLWISKGTKLKPSDPLGVDGWIMNVYTEKNKLAPSQFYIPLIFDKKWGVIPHFSEYHFLKEKTKTEMRYWPNPKKLVYPFCITSSANSKVLKVIDPQTGNTLYDSGKFMERRFQERWSTDSEFKYWFDKAVEISIEQRLRAALFRDSDGVVEIAQTNGDADLPDEDGTEASIASAFDQVAATGTPDNTPDQEYINQVSAGAATPQDDPAQYEQAVENVDVVPVEEVVPQPMAEQASVEVAQEPVGATAEAEEESNPFLQEDQ